MLQRLDLSAAVRDHDFVSIALETFHAIDTLKPLEVASFVYRNPEEERSYQERLKTLEPEPDRTDSQRLCDRAAANAENARRLRTTMWAEVTLRNTAHFEFANMLAQWHREQWRIALVSADSAERERQIQHVIAQKAREHGSR